jgi:putative phosphoribosyl transferase
MGESAVTVQAGSAELDGDLTVPDDARGVVVFAHGSGSSRRSPRNREVAAALQGAGLATLLFDLLTPAEEQVDVVTREHRFDIDLLAMRLVGATQWLESSGVAPQLAVGYFGASTGAAAALVAAAQLPGRVAAVVSRGGRPDLAGRSLARVACPVQLIVGGADTQVLALNREAAAQLPGSVDLEIVAGAGHLFEEPGALEQVSRLAGEFLNRHLPAAG